MNNREELLGAAAGWYMGSVVAGYLRRVLSAEEEVAAWYEAFLNQQLDGSYTAKYYICTRTKLLILVVSAFQIESRVFPLAGLHKMTTRIPLRPGHRADWPKTECICRFLVGTEPEQVAIDFPAREDQVPGYYALVRAVARGG